MINCNLIIDGNYILNRNTFALHKNNLLYGSLMQSLEMSISNYRKWFPFNKVYIVSDSREKSWRKKIHSEYKSQRKRDTDIDWNFVYDVYNEFKANIKHCSVLETPHIEGDDWISYLVNMSNKKAESCFIVSNDYDIKQLISYNTDPLYINIMFNEIYNKQKVFLPKNYNIFLNKLNSYDHNDLFNMNYDYDFIKLINDFIEKYETIEIDPIESLIVKVISGDVSDNISSVWQIEKNGKKRGIGDSGAKKIYNEYINDHGFFDLNSDFIEDLSEIIILNKKLTKSDLPKLKENLKQNLDLVNLNIANIPPQVVSRMNDTYKKIFNI